jgi:microcystin-dependent protein
MGSPYIGEIRMFAGNFAPSGWAFCEGQTIAISENETLFNLIGTTYGGDGQETFNLPDLRGRIPIHMGTNAGSTHIIGELAGVETVTLTPNQIPAHTHPVQASSSVGDQATALNNVLAQTQGISIYSPIPPAGTMAPNIVTLTGGNQPHDNFMPYLCVNFIISLFGIFPSPT